MLPRIHLQVRKEFIMTEENGNKGSKERQGIALVIFPDWKGARTYRGIGIEGTVTDKDGKKTKLKQPFRFDTNIPVPATDAEAQELYSCKLSDLIEAGVMKLSYDRDTDIGNEITAELEKGTDFATIDDVSKFEKALQDGMSTPKERTPSMAKENKKLANQLTALMGQYNVSSVEELDKLIASAKKKK